MHTNVAITCIIPSHQLWMYDLVAQDGLCHRRMCQWHILLFVTEIAIEACMYVTYSMSNEEVHLRKFWCSCRHQIAAIVPN